MLTRSNQLGNPEKFYNDAMVETPTVARSVYDSLASGFATPTVALNMLDGEMAKKPEGKAILNSLESINLERQAPGIGWGQWLADEGASMLGYALNPITWAFGEVGGAATRGAIGVGGKGLSRILPNAASVFMRKPLTELLARPISRYLPSMIGKEGAEKSLSMGLLTDKTLQTFGTFAGAGVPQGIADSFNKDTGNINWGGVAREAGEMGAFGLAIGAIPFAWGVLRGKVNRGLGNGVDAVVDRSALDKALEKGFITADEHKWYGDYLDHQKEPGNEAMTKDLQQRGSDIINRNGHRANTVSNEALFDILSPDDVSNLHGVIADQLASAHLPDEQRMALSDYIVHNRMDYLRRDPKSLDGVRGYVDFINQKLEMKNPKLLEADRILDEHLMKGAKENMPFSQKELFKMMKKSGFEASHIQHLPVTIPENMVSHLKLLEKISKLKVKLQKAKRAGKPENKQTLRRVEELEKKLPKILTPKEELASLRESLLGKGLPANFERSSAYHRLLDLSSAWHNARTLLDRVHLEHDYNRQQAFRDIAHQVLRMSDSEQPTLAKPENVIDYLKKRVESNLSKLEPISEINKEVGEKLKVPTDSDEILTEQSQQVKDSKAESGKEELEQSSSKFKEFKDSENIFKNLISCVMGGLGG